MSEPTPPPGGEMSEALRALRPWFALSTGLLVLGIVLAAIAGGRVWVTAVGFGIGTLGAVGLVALFFYGVGRSEDLARSREEALRRRG